MNDMADENIQPSCSSIPAPAFTDFSEDETSDREFESFTLFNGMVFEFCNEKKTYLGRKLQMNSRRNFVLRILIAKAMISVLTTKFK